MTLLLHERPTTPALSSLFGVDSVDWGWDILSFLWKEKKEGKWMWLKPIDCETSSRGIEESWECWLMPQSEGRGGDNGFHFVVCAFFMVQDRAGTPSVWLRWCGSAVNLLWSSKRDFSAACLLTSTAREKVTTDVHHSEIYSNRDRNVLCRDLISLLPLALIGLRAKWLLIRVS